MCKLDPESPFLAADFLQRPVATSKRQDAVPDASDPDYDFGHPFDYIGERVGEYLVRCHRKLL